MARKTKGKSRANRNALQNRALNAFDIAEDESNAKLERRLKVNDINLDEASDDENARLMSGEVAPEDDEEIDSDEAMGSDDDYDLLDKKNRHKDESDSEEIDVNDLDDGDYTDIDESELKPLSELWDMADQSPSDSDVAHDIDESMSESLSESSDDDEDDESDSGDDADEVDDMLLESDDEASESDEEGSRKLRDAISNLVKDTAVDKKKKRKQLEATKATENEFGLPSQSEKLSFSDLLNNVTDPAAAASLKLLQSKNGVAVETKPLAIPLPKHIQDRHDRKAAYDITKDEVSKWEDTVKANRRAEHLVFPINPPVPLEKASATAPLEPKTDLEKKIQGTLEASALADEKALSTFEELATSKLSVEEVKRRRNELRLMRELAFREEQRAKRIKKIKSKSYRKVHKKERQRLQAMMEDEEGDEELEDRESKRAEERMSLKHKSNSKWAKRMVEQGFTKDRETRAEMEEMLSRGDELRRKIMGDDDNESDRDDQFLESSDEEDPKNEQHESLGKGLLNMKFMRDAAEAERKENARAKEELRKLRDGETGFEELEEPENSANIILNEGRRIFAPGTDTSSARDALTAARDEQEDEDSRLLVNRLAPKKKSSGDKDDKRESGLSVGEVDESNPWLQVESTKRASNKVSLMGKDSSVQEKNQEKIRKQKGKSSGPASANVEIDMNQTLSIVDANGSDDEAEDDSAATSQIQFRQQDLVAKAFAGDDVVEEFASDKKRKIEEEGDQEIDVTLPGWGSWGGNDIQPKKRFVKKVKGVKESERRDAKLKNVIINEKVNKKTQTYSVNSVPFPFETREQYERSLRMPIGREWSSRDTFQKMTKPRVIVKQGSVIDPLKAPFK